MKRRMVTGKAPNPEAKMVRKDPGHMAARPTEKKAEKADVMPTRKVPKDRNTGGAKSVLERLRNKRI